MSRLRIQIATALTAIAAVGSLVMAPAASAGPPSYLHVVESYGFGANQQFSGGYVSCPSGTKAMSSGAMGSGPLMAGLTTFDGNGAYATAARGWVADERVQVFAHCVEAGNLTGSTRASVTVRDTRPGWHYRSRRVSCPTGTLGYGGGSFVNTPSGPSQGGLYTYESIPDGNGWRYSGAGYLDGNQFIVNTHCLPRARLGNIVTVTATDSSTPTDYNLLATARCPAGYSAFAGGAWFHGTDSHTPMYVGHLNGSNTAADNRGWTAFGNTYGPARLTTKVSCTDRLG
jgi:hypothetical protein